MSITKARDRDAAVTLPVLIEAPRSDSDGTIEGEGKTYRDNEQLREANIYVRIVPLEAANGIFDSKSQDKKLFERLEHSQREKLRILTYLIRSIRENDPQIAKQYAEFYSKRSEQPPGLSDELNIPLKRARFVFWTPKKSGGLIPGLYCDDAFVALVALLASHVNSPQSFSVCARCQKPFYSVKRDQKFCSTRCGNAERKARQRHGRKQRDAILLDKNLSAFLSEPYRPSSKTDLRSVIETLKKPPKGERT